ncbi:MAG: hypothetical protein E3J46_12495 [Desulfobacteraceae bacterium]|nr:MAG: hypothetical protein E3J46_12495 [Desulfobacteraceae bacterium]
MGLIYESQIYRCPCRHRRLFLKKLRQRLSSHSVAINTHDLYGVYIANVNELPAEEFKDITDVGDEIYAELATKKGY